MTASFRGDAVGTTVARPGGSLYVVDQPGEEPPIVLMHGFPDDHRIYDRLIPCLASRRVVAFDWLGYGRSSRRNGSTFESSDRQRDLETVLNELGLNDVVLVGHDASGPVAIDYALAHADRVKAITLMNTFYGYDPALRFPEMIALLADPVYRDLASALMDDEAQRLWLLQHSAAHMGVQPADPEGIASVSILPQFFGDPEHPNALDEIRGWIADLPRALQHQDDKIASSQLSGLHIPITVASGADDPYLNVDLSQHLASLFPVSRLQLVRTAGHWPQWEQPERLSVSLKTAHTWSP
jgi:pimeloyl-ACP methyl ester carboxylesterase